MQDNPKQESTKLKKAMTYEDCIIFSPASSKCDTN